jgi:CRP-like cAMP-binding protein
VADFEAFLQAHGRVAFLLIRTVIGRIRDADRKRIEFGAHDTIGRVAARLVEMAERFGQAHRRRAEDRAAVLPGRAGRLDRRLPRGGEQGAGRAAAAGTIRTSRMSVVVRDLPDLRRRAPE